MTVVLVLDAINVARVVIAGLVVAAGSANWRHLVIFTVDNASSCFSFFQPRPLFRFSSLLRSDLLLPEHLSLHPSTYIRQSCIPRARLCNGGYGKTIS